MKAVLSQDLPVSLIAVFAELAWLERRPELGLLCKAASGRGQRITVATVQSALPGLSDAGATNVIAWCVTLGLCDKHGGLTELGEDVAESNEAPIPEQGVYGMWLVEHPLMGCRVLAVERRASKQYPQFENIKPLPLEPQRKKVFRSVVDPKERFVIRDLPANHGQIGCIVGETESTCRLQWTLDFDAARDHWQLDGRIEVPQSGDKYAMRQLHHQPETDEMDLWRLAEYWGQTCLREFGMWSAAEQRLAVPFEKLTTTEIETFRKTLRLRQADVPGKGAYADVELEDVPIGPFSKDVQRWAMSRFEQHIVKQPIYRSRAEVRSRFAELTEGTPLEKYSPSLPAHDELLRSYEKDQAAFWAMAAPVDLSPFPVSPNELGAMRIGSAPPTATTSEASENLRIPYRGGWSMQQLVSRLVASNVPRRVLLCDRYVRGVENLETLKLFVQAIRSCGPSAIIEVWTSDEDNDFKAIQTVTGTSPRKYRDVFGKYPPHDRYVLVVPKEGGGVGWQLSNSPLHARADVAGATAETPLRWKDLTGTRLSPEKLEPTFRQWFTGGLR